MRKIQEGFVVESEDLRGLARLRFVARICAIGDEASRQGGGGVEGHSGRQPEAGYDDSIESSPAILQRAAIPFDRKVKLKSNRRRIGVIGLNLSEHLAISRAGGRNAARRRRCRNSGE